jgi:hypothetical protein
MYFKKGLNQFHMFNKDTHTAKSITFEKKYLLQISCPLKKTPSNWTVAVIKIQKPIMENFCHSLKIFLRNTQHPDL